MIPVLTSINHFFFHIDDNETLYPFNGNNAKNKIAIYQLKKSQLDFRLVIRCEKTDEFLDTNIYCRSDELIEGTFYSFILSFFNYVFSRRRN